MRAVVLIWPGAALAMTFVDDFLAGPLLAASGFLFGVSGGFVLAVVAFSLFVGVLCTTAAMAMSRLEGPHKDRLMAAFDAARQRRHLGRFVDAVGDDKPVATAIVAVVVSPVLAVLAARLSKPRHSLNRTILIATVSYGFVFSVTYAGGGALLSGWL